MATNDHRPGDTTSDSQITNTGQRASIPNTEDIDANDIDSKDNKVEVTNDLDSADVRAPETQGSNLPKLTRVIITNVRQLKLSSKNPEEWTLRVRHALAQLRLQHLINSSVPRPAKGQCNCSRWVQWSRTVASWLYLQVDRNIQERLQQLHRIPSKADALFDGIMKIVRERGTPFFIRLLTNKYDYDSRKRSDFETARNYITAHRSQYHLLGSNLLPISALR
ncbi:unnamed protein product [Penicillium nalgiovense]|uniref:Uncharacterized protein n=1 Tax=Penicillium nalgiovense TaxID=60175 RepID=A0A9W4MXT8_PENNA|nr:unnamed protein product [Penicillium nalgiovense]CAG8027821.1 unnamed protein product [Penicillium nalgiovense]CAG8188944.1 unnamed protein product [Penicillium nalgiovense]CAG8190497.1 unnamed protein product [Penicillium nalgiovense]CAG8197771.1 unnamed protein product [Penicillium nalgiovense]